jgi:hypothetical protein
MTSLANSLSPRWWAVGLLSATCWAYTRIKTFTNRWIYPSKVLLGTIVVQGFPINVYTDSSIIGLYTYRYIDRPNTWFETSDLLHHLANGENIPFGNFVQKIGNGGETIRSIIVHSLTWAGGPKQKSWRFMAATVDASSVPYPFFYLFRGDCVAILPVLHMDGEKYGLTCMVKKGFGWQGETLAGMTADTYRNECDPADPDIMVAIAELKEEFGAVFKGIKVRRVGPPAKVSIGGCDESCSPYVTDMKVTKSFIKSLEILTSQYGDEKFTFIVEKLDEMELNDSKKALCYAGYLKNPPKESDFLEGLSGHLSAEDLLFALSDRMNELRNEGSIKDADNVSIQIAKIEASFPHFHSEEPKAKSGWV